MQSRYDERIITYGFDDEDLYQRVTSLGYNVRNFDYDLMSHIVHDDAMRTKILAQSPYIEERKNAKLTSMVEPWHKTKGNFGCTFRASPIPHQCLCGKPFTKPPSHLDSLTLEQYHEALLYAMFEWGYKLYFSKRTDILMVAVDQPSLKQRMEAMAAGINAAKESHRTLLLAWEPTRDCNATVDALFNVYDAIPSGVAVISKVEFWKYYTELTVPLQVIKNATVTLADLDDLAKIIMVDSDSRFDQGKFSSNMIADTISTIEASIRAELTTCPKIKLPKGLALFSRSDPKAVLPHRNAQFPKGIVHSETK